VTYLSSRSSNGHDDSQFGADHSAVRNRDVDDISIGDLHFCAAEDSNMLSCLRADERQGNGACSSDGAGLLLLPIFLLINDFNFSG
jgi:hypothetical protein